MKFELNTSETVHVYEKMHCNKEKMYKMHKRIKYFDTILKIMKDIKYTNLQNEMVVSNKL
jgi:hypothetical protein